MKSLNMARCLALQVLYEVDMASHPPADVFQARLEDTPLPDDLAEFARQIIFGVFPLEHKLDHEIEKYAPEWPLDQIAAIERNILRISCWEFAIQNQTPVKVAIYEAVEMAKLYGSDSAPRFVNGVLGSLAEHEYDIRQQILAAQKDAGNENEN